MGRSFHWYFQRTYKQKITIGNIYRPPKFNNSNPTMEDFMLELNPVTDKLSKENSYSVFYWWFQYESFGNQYEIKLSSILWSICHTKSLSKNCTTNKIHKKERFDSWQFFFKLNENMIKSYSRILLSYISDHLPISTCLDIYKSNKQQINKYIMIEKER